MAENLPIVAIVGRRNVGKSTLFNALIKKKVAIVDDFPGLTRDILSYRITYDDREFMLVDTPGLDLPVDAELSDAIIKVANAAIERADVTLLLLENPAAEGFDFDLHDTLRKSGKPFVIAINKMDTSEDYENLTNFYELGADDFVPISAKNRSNLDILLEKMTFILPEKKGSHKEADIRISFVGKPNAGKSTLLNALIGYERSVVSDIPGTTRDSVNEMFAFHGKTVEVVDTAGLRKKSKIKESVEFFSLTRTQRSIERSDVVIHLIDAMQGITDTDKKIADEIMKANKPMIIAVNKWDKIQKDTNTFNEYIAKLRKMFFRTGDFPVISISALEKTRIHKLMLEAVSLCEGAKQHIDTGELNRHIERLQRSGRLPGFGSDLKVFYVTQMNTYPPTFKFFVNDASKCRQDAIRFFQKELLKILGIKGIPVNIKVEGRDKKGAKGKRR